MITKKNDIDLMIEIFTNCKGFYMSYDDKYDIMFFGICYKSYVCEWQYRMRDTSEYKSCFMSCRNNQIKVFVYLYLKHENIIKNEEYDKYVELIELVKSYCEYCVVKYKTVPLENNTNSFRFRGYAYCPKQIIEKQVQVPEHKPKHISHSIPWYVKLSYKIIKKYEESKQNTTKA